MVYGQEWKSVVRAIDVAGGTAGCDGPGGDRSPRLGIGRRKERTCLVAMALAAIEVHGWGSGEGKNELVLYFLAAAFVPKAIQKFAEGARR